jgi:hypothetical protein
MAASEAETEFVVNNSQLQGARKAPSFRNMQHGLADRILDWAEVGAVHLHAPPRSRRDHYLPAPMHRHLSATADNRKRIVTCSKFIVASIQKTLGHNAQRQRVDNVDYIAAIRTGSGGGSDPPERSIQGFLFNGGITTPKSSDSYMFSATRTR